MFFSNAGIIQCTNCAMIQDPFCEYTIKCNGCNNNLTHPISAKIIQCPLCLTFMDVSDKSLWSMDLIELTPDILLKCSKRDKHKQNLKRKLQTDDNENNHEFDITSDSNTTVTNQSISNYPKYHEKYEYGIPKKRRKIVDINDYNEQWIDYQSNKMFEFQPNRPINNQWSNNPKHCNIKHLNNNIKKSVNKCQSELNKNDEKPQNVNSKISKYGSFKMTSLTFI